MSNADRTIRMHGTIDIAVQCYPKGRERGTRANGVGGGRGCTKKQSSRVKKRGPAGGCAGGGWQITTLNVISVYQV